LTPAFIVGFVVSILFCGFSLDVARIELAKTQMQTATDAAAIGAELEFERNTYVDNNGTWGYMNGYTFVAGGTNTWLAAAQGDASLNGYTNGQNNTTVTVQQGPTSGAYLGRQDALQATITYQINTLFMGALNGGKYTLTTQAVALIPPCVYAMNSTGLNFSFTLSNTNVNSYCPVYVNQGLSIDSSSYIYSTSLNVVGSNDVDNGKSVPPPKLNEPAITDPLSSITAPTFAACSAGHTTTMTVHGNGGYAGQGYGGLNLEPVFLNPGTYCGGFDFAQADVQFAPGLYIITGNMTVNDSVMRNNPMVTSSAPNVTGATLYFTKGGNYNYGTLTIEGNSSILLNAPTLASGGNYAGIVFFWDRLWAGNSQSSSTNSLVCNDAYFLGSGIWYSINSNMSFTTCSNAADTYWGLVANSISFTNVVYNDTLGVAPNSNFSNLSYGNPFRSKAVLVQ
jgi:hypothetical protein